MSPVVFLKKYNDRSDFKIMLRKYRKARRFKWSVKDLLQSRAYNTSD